MMKTSHYKYRRRLIMRWNDKWTITTPWESSLDYQEYNTIKAAKDAIDKMDGVNQRIN